MTLLARVGDGAFVYRDLNPAAERGYGLARAEVIGRDLRDVIGTAAAAAPIRAMVRCIATGQDQRFVARRTMAGATRLIDVRVALVPGPEPLLALAARDISAFERVLGSIVGVRETRGRARPPPPFDGAALGIWQARLGITCAAAALALGLSLGGYRKQRDGSRPVSWQTYRLSCDIEMLLMLRLAPVGWPPTVKMPLPVRTVVPASVERADRPVERDQAALALYIPRGSNGTLRAMRAATRSP